MTTTVREPLPLLDFAADQLHAQNISQIRQNSTAVILSCAYFMGAARTLKTDQQQLLDFLAQQLAVDDRAAGHLVDTTQRLAGKYALINEIIRLGATAASPDSPHSISLSDVLARYQRLSLMELGIRGITPAEEEAVTEKTGTTPEEVAQRHRHWKKAAYILAAILLLLLINYLIWQR